jgi:ferric hydroxamate transport system substrate-binding protein
MAIVLVLMLLVVAACGDDDDSSDNGDDQEPTATEQTTGGESTATGATGADDDATEETDDATADDVGSDDATAPDDATADDDADDGSATADDAGSTPADSATSESTEAASGDDSGTRTVEHALGSLEIEGVPQTIVALEWTYAEDLLALGVQPAGVADVEGYKTWVNVEPALSDDVVDVGTRQEPSLESIAALEPDLIIGVQFRHEPIYDQLSSIAPTLLFNPYPEDPAITQLDEMEQTLMAIATAVNREEEGQQVLDDMHAYFDDAAAQIAELNLDDDDDGGDDSGDDDDGDFALVQAFTSEDTPQIRIFTDNSMAVQIFEAIGLENDWEGEFDPFGFNTVGIEALTEVDDAYFFYVAQDDDNPFEDTWADNPVWTDLDFVEDGKVYPLGGDTWLFGGPLSAELIVDKVVAAFAG